jgi:sugar-specific transcriptional regulator TrmB
MNERLLEQIGLTEGETKVYLALIKLGETRTGQLAKEAEVSSSKVYKILDRLEKKGLAGSITKGKVKYFQAMEPRSILEYMEEKQNELNEKTQLIKQLIPQLELERKKSKEKTKATLYEGWKAIFNIYRGAIEDLKSGEEYFVIGAYYPKNKPFVRDFYQNYHTQRAKRKVKVNMLANYETKGNLVPATLIHSEVRFLPQYFLTKMTILFYKNKAFFIFPLDEPIGFMIDSKEATEGLKSYFNVLWKIAKP